MGTNGTVRDRGYGLVKESRLLEYSKCLAVPIGRRGRSELKDGRSRKGYADPMGYNRVVNNVTSLLVLRAFLVEPGNLGIRA